MTAARTPGARVSPPWWRPARDAPRSRGCGGRAPGARRYIGWESPPDGGIPREASIAE
ncbi:hypothetical protein GCM10010251_61950 [Streptomyces aurantiogriseus]|uniref:Uncharacterized protein n=1 Tax=Streptomyces aurantiogriseus TaxID=66870 RepID=A0A918KW98_9ACTN|nr:hypothetical protein GCM10010251_61950 [Streptomyces aurantiogriseus]